MVKLTKWEVLAEDKSAAAESTCALVFKLYIGSRYALCYRCSS